MVLEVYIKQEAHLSLLILWGYSVFRVNPLLDQEDSQLCQILLRLILLWQNILLPWVVG